MNNGRNMSMRDKFYTPKFKPVVVGEDKTPANFEMYRIYESTARLPVFCHCTQTDCHQCGNKGWHYKTFLYWRLAKHTTTIEAVSSVDGELRFWSSRCDFWPKDTIGDIVFFTKQDAMNACSERNEDFYRKLSKAQKNPKLRDKIHFKP